MSLSRTSPHVLLLCLTLSHVSLGRALAASIPGMARETTFDSHPEAGGGAYDVMNDVVATDDGGAAAAGYSIPPGSGASNNQEPSVIRLDAAGSELWRTYLRGCSGAVGFEARRIRATSDRGFVVACTAWNPYGPGSGGMYYSTSFVAKINAEGLEQWRYDFDPLSVDEVGDIDVLPDGSVVAAGRVWTDGEAPRRRWQSSRHRATCSG